VTVELPTYANLDALIDPIIKDVTDRIDLGSTFLADMARYHLGLVDRRFQPVETASVDRGKRMRPRVAMLCCAAAGGDPADAAPLAAAIEILHNFTLVHDDIQDQSALRRHQPTVWSLWGASQAINAGDALFAAAQLALLQLAETECRGDRIVALSRAFNLMAIEIVNGQALDLTFEDRDDVRLSEYLRMITAKTSVIVRYAAWAGATIGGADDASAGAFGRFGLALGLGFQIRDDLLGIWGTTRETGKPAADDIRRRKKSLPILTLLDQVDSATREEIGGLYRSDSPEEARVARMLALLNEHRIRPLIEQEVRHYHDLALEALLSAAPRESPARQELIDYTDRLSRRGH
jgi:geranylgeranyl diphosphate synthase type I